MKTIKLFTVVTFSLMLLSITALADEKVDTDVKKELKNQTNCPVMGGKIDSTVYTDIQGQRVYHCCPMCSAKLKADPDKYFKKAAEEGILFENIQTTCPVSGEKLEDKLVYSDYEGRRIYFCCKKCRGTFAEEPHKFLDKMDIQSEKNNGEDDMDMEHDSTEDHSGHSH